MAESELREIFGHAFERLKRTFYKNYRIEEREEDNPPYVLTLRDMIESLPPATQVIEIVGPPMHQFLKNGRGFLFKYDFDHLKSEQFEFLGAVDHKNPEKLVSLLVDKCGIDERKIREYAKGLCADFNLTGYFSPPQSWYLHFIQDDILKNPEAFHREVIFNFLMVPNDILYHKFERTEHPNYSEMFNLLPDSILRSEEILKADRTSQTLNIDLQNLQRRIAHLKLIPNVPEGARHAFHLAKELFIFGYYRYGFFTIAQHYAFLALEAAVKARYVASLGSSAKLTDRKNRQLHYEMKNPRYYLIESFCRQQGWNRHTLLVNGEPFPHTGKKLLKWLVDKHLIRKWEMGRYDAGLQIRNSLSHLEGVTITYPDASLLERVAEQINYLFYTKQN